MRSYQTACLLLMIACSACSYGQTWKQYSDSAKIFLEQKKNDKAIEWYSKAIEELKKDSVGTKSYVAACGNLAILYATTGQFNKAEPLFLETKQIREKLLGKENPYYATSCNNLALLYRSMGQYMKAEQLFLEAKQIREKVLGKEHPDYAGCCNNLALLYRNMGEYNKAEPLLLEAKRIQEKVLGKKHSDYAASCNNLALLYINMGQYDNAEALLLESKEIREKIVGKQHPDYAGCCENLALLYRDIGQYEKSASLLEEANQILKKQLGMQHPEYGKSCEELANLYWLMHLPLKAEKRFEESFSVMTYNLFSVFQFTNEKEKAAYIENIFGEDDLAYSFYLSEKIRSGQPYSLSLFHRNLVLSSSQTLRKQLSSANDTALISKYLKWVNLKNHLSILYSRPVDERKEDATELEEKAGVQEKELTRLSAPFAKQQQRVDWKDIQKKLKIDEASIEFTSFHVQNGKRRTDTVFYVAILLRKNRPSPVTVFLCNERQLSASLSSAGMETTREVIQKLYTPPDVAVNEKQNGATLLYDLVWKPLEKKLNGIRTVYFAPSGMLHKIAFAALPVSKNEILSDRYKLIQLATTASVSDQQHMYVTASDKIQLYGGISYDADTNALKDVALSYRTEKGGSRSLPDDLIRSGGWNELPGTKKEVEGIMLLSRKYGIHTTALTGMNATEESLKALDGRASPAVLHIATHGFFFPDPKLDVKDQRSYQQGEAFKLSDDPLMRSGLLLAGANNAWQNKPVEGIDDGILTAYEVSNLYLPNTKLAVLSACETGLGEIHGSEGVYGLQRAFKLAGVQNIVMSLWKVSDLEAAEFMEAFYKNLLIHQSISDAFYNVQRTMKNKYRLQPYKWAAWVLVR